MSDIINVIDLTLKSLDKQNKLANPTNFEIEFYNQLKKTDLILEETEDIKYLLSLLNNHEKKQLTNDTITFRELAKVLSKRVSNQTIKEFLKDFSYFISPSLEQEIKSEIDEICLKLSEDTNSLFDNKVLREIRTITDKRIDNDKNLFKDKTNDVKKLITFLSEYINKYIVNHKSTFDEIADLEEELKSLCLSKSSTKDLENIKSSLLDTIVKFKDQVKVSQEDMNEKQLECNTLYEQIEKLQHNLDKAEEEKSTDYLTSVLTRRAYAFEIKRIESEFKAYDSKYTLVFFDIDHFKDVNDKYGHECGDAVLSTFAQILKNLTRTGDIIARYGGEEFVSIVN